MRDQNILFKFIVSIYGNDTRRIIEAKRETTVEGLSPEWANENGKKKDGMVRIAYVASICVGLRLIFDHTLYVQSGVHISGISMA